MEKFPEFTKIDIDKYLMEHDNAPDPSLYWNNFKVKFYKPPVGVDQEELERIKSLAADVSIVEGTTKTTEKWAEYVATPERQKLLEEEYLTPFGKFAMEDSNLWRARFKGEEFDDLSNASKFVKFANKDSENSHLRGKGHFWANVGAEAEEATRV